MLNDIQNTSLKEKLKSLPKSELEKLVLKAASKHKEFNTFLHLIYIDKEQTENDLYEATLKDINQLMRKNYKGFSHELQLANMLTACNKRVSEFSKLCKNKKAELDLLMVILEIPFKYAPSGSLGTCFTVYDYKVSQILKKAITLITTKLHPDYKIEYCDKINLYLTILHGCSSHNDFIYSLPRHI
jgi:hypothetical protein